MRYLLILPIVLISLCIDLSQIQMPTTTQSQQVGVVTIDAGSPDIFINVQVLPPEIKSGRSVQMTFELRNKQLYDLENVVLNIFDHPCFPDNLNTGLFSKNFGTIKANRSAFLTLKLTSEPNIVLSKDCLTKFMISYDASYSYFQDIAVLSQSEYDTKSMAGTLKDIPIQTSSTESAFGISLSFSDQQPFLENQKEYYMYINYFNKGEGFLNSIDLRLSPPSNIRNLSCRDYTSGFTLNKTLTFIKGKANPSVCIFDTPSISAMDIKSFEITASYKYVLDNSISIRVKP